MRNLALAAVLLVVGAAPAGAHHTTATTHVGASPYRLGGLTGLRAPRLEFGFAYQLHVFDRLIEDTVALSSDSLGNVTVHMVSLPVAAVFSGGTRLDISVPFGFADVRDAERDLQRTLGMGDLLATISQDVVALVAEPGPLSVNLRAGLVMPTGRYAPDDVLAATRLRPGAEGSLNLSTYNMNASLGRGAWAAIAGAQVAWSPSRGARMEADLTVVVPLSRTADEVLWGADVLATVGGCVELVPGVLGACPGLVGRHHARDMIKDLDETSGAPVRRRVGGRVELAMRLGFDVTFTEGFGCTLSGELPVYQRAGGLQLVESVSFRVGCRFLSSLAD
jgi:hypothetical protein